MSRIERWLFDPRPMQAMVAARILLGAIVLGSYLIRLPDFSLLYGANSVAWFSVYRQYVAGYWQPVLEPLVELVARYGLQDRAWIAFGLLLLSALSFCVGYRTRLAGATAFVLHNFFWAVNPDTSWGWPLMLSSFLLYVTLAPSGRHFSIDAWIRSRRAGGSPTGHAAWSAPAWPLRLLQVNVCTMYLVAGWSRIDDPGWLDGIMLIEALTNPSARIATDWLRFQPILRLLSYAVFVLEPLAPFGLWPRRTRTLFALSLIAMHLGLELLVDVGWWNYVMIAGLLTFLPVAWLDAAFRKLGSSTSAPTAETPGG